MKKLLPFLVWIILMTGCNNKPQNNTKKSNGDTLLAKIDTARKILSVKHNPHEKEYSEEEVADLSSFLDSIGHLDLEKYGKRILRRADSIFQNIRPLNISLSDKQFTKLKTCIRQGRINLVFAREIFPMTIDSDMVFNEYEGEDKKANSCEINYFSFDSITSEFDEFAISLGSSSMHWQNQVYFFKHNRIIAYQNVYHRYGLEIKSFRDADGKTVVYYKENFGSGTGISQFNYFFYKYFDRRLKPVLNTICSSVNWGPECHRRFESRVISKSPLIIKYNYQIDFFEPFTDQESKESNFLNDSAIIKFNWNSISQAFKANFSGNLKEREMPCYYLEGYYSSFYTYNYYYPKLKAILNGPHDNDRNNVLASLAYLRNK